MRSSMAKIRMSSSDSQNSGMQLVMVPSLQTARSKSVPSRCAQNIPSSSESVKISTKPTPPRRSVLPRAARDDLARGHFVLIRDAEIPVQGVCASGHTAGR